MIADYLIWKVNLSLNINELCNKSTKKQENTNKQENVVKEMGHWVRRFTCVLSCRQSNEMSLLNLRCQSLIFLRMAENPCSVMSKCWWILFPHKRQYWIPASDVNSDTININSYTVVRRHTSFWYNLIHIAKQKFLFLSPKSRTNSRFDFHFLSFEVSLHKK